MIVKQPKHFSKHKTCTALFERPMLTIFGALCIFYSIRLVSYKVEGEVLAFQIVTGIHLRLGLGTRSAALIVLARHTLKAE